MANQSTVNAAGLDLPPGFALVKMVGGVDGVNGYLGDVQVGHLYTVSKSEWKNLAMHCSGQFAPARPEDVAAIEAWGKEDVAEKTPAAAANVKARK